MKVQLGVIFLLLLNHHVHSLNDIDELDLTYNEIRQLINRFNNYNLQKAVDFAVDSTDKSKFLERQIALKAKIINGTISHANLIETLPDDDAKSIDNLSQIILKASSYLLNTLCKPHSIGNKDCVKFMSKYSLPALNNLTAECNKKVANVKYLGYRRLLPASYRDGLQQIRGSFLGKDLPLPRIISSSFFAAEFENLKLHNKNNVINHEGVLDANRNLAIPQWTQFIEQDISKAVSRSLSNGNPLECCDKESVPIQPRFLHPSACMPISIPSNDPYYSKIRVTCLNYVRSAIAIEDECKFGAINQLNQATNKFDLSQLYGNGDDVEKKLRNLNQGLLLTSTVDSSLLPFLDDESCINGTFSSCYQSGDSRVNYSPIVTSIYIVFLRSHNQIAQKLKRMHSKWSDEKLFKITKDINVAIYQKIIYNDWANVVMGKRIGDEIRSKTHERDSRRYNTKKVSNEFGAAGIKFYHSMLPGDVKSQNDNNLSGSSSYSLDNVIEEEDRQEELFKLEDVFYKPKDLSKFNLFDRLMNSILNQNAMSMDSNYVDDLSLHLYRTKMYGGKTFGADAFSFDIQKGRDHGLPSYLEYINRCLNIKINSWDDLRNIVNEDDLDRMRTVYASVRDVDLIVGGLSEVPNENATIGPTFSCIISDQLISSKLADVKFYDRKGDEHGEKIAKTIEKYSAARLMCDISRLRAIQANIFLLPSDDNPLIECSNYEQLPKLDLSYWMDIQKQT